jgi:O-antigen/teichoic acid export membrane protein
MDRLIKKYKPKIQQKFSQDGASWLFLQQLLIAPMSLLTTVLLAGILSISDYGYYKYVLSIYSIAATFGLTGFYSIASLNIQRGQDVFFYIGFRYRKIMRWLPVFITIMIAAYYFIKGNDFFGTLFLITIFSHLFVDLYDFYMVGTAGRGNYRLNAILAIINYFISFFPPIIVAYFTHNLYL